MKKKTFAFLPILPLMFLILGFKSTVEQPKDFKISMARGKEIYERVCIACHQADAGGVPNMIPPLTGTKWVLGDKKVMINIVLKALKGGEIEINGDTFANPMPAQDELMTDQEIADVITYVRNSFGNKASAVRAAEVKALRKAK